MLELISLYKKEFHEGGFCIFRIFIFCSKFLNYFNKYIKIVASIANFVLSSFISPSPPPGPPPPPVPPYPPTLWVPTTPWQSFVYSFFTVPWAGPPSLTEFHSIDNQTNLIQSGENTINCKSNLIIVWFVMQTFDIYMFVKTMSSS